MGIMLFYARFISRVRNTDLRPIFLLIILVATWLALNLVMPNGLSAQDRRRLEQQLPLSNLQPVTPIEGRLADASL
jgi:hypothetical protein